MNSKIDQFTNWYAYAGVMGIVLILSQFWYVTNLYNLFAQQKHKSCHSNVGRMFHTQLNQLRTWWNIVFHGGWKNCSASWTSQSSMVVRGLWRCLPSMQMMELLLWLLSASIEVKNRRAGSSKPASPVLQVVICNRFQPLRIGLVPRLVLACERPQLCICVHNVQHLVCFLEHTHAEAKSKSTNWLRIVSHWQETWIYGFDSDAAHCPKQIPSWKLLTIFNPNLPRGL